MKTPTPSTIRRPVLLGALGAVALVVTLLLLRPAADPMKNGPEPAESPNPITPPPSRRVMLAHLRTEDAPPAKSEAAVPAQAALTVADQVRVFAQRFAALPGQFGGTASPEFQEASRQTLDDLRKYLRETPSDVSAAGMASFLDSHEDASTGLSFTVGPGGLLGEAPSVRTALLDALAQADPGLSVEYGKRIFNESQSPDEWALAMRNLGWQNQNGEQTEEIRGRLGEMLDNQQWLATPSAGFLEAFDLAVHLGGAPEIGNMASVLRLKTTEGQPADNGVSRAAYIALDRIGIRNPAQTVQMIDTDPSLLAWAPENRAALMARANLADADQRAAVERYFLRNDLPPEEIEVFASLFPNRNGSLGDTLVSTTNTELDFAQNIVADRLALEAVTRWQSDPRFQARQGELQQMSGRLTAFVTAASNSQPAAPSAPSGVSVLPTE